MTRTVGCLDALVHRPRKNRKRQYLATVPSITNSTTGTLPIRKLRKITHQKKVSDQPTSTSRTAFNRCWSPGQNQK